MEAPTYDYYDQAEILDGTDEGEEEEESSEQPEVGARAQVQLRVDGSFRSKTSNAFSCPIVFPTSLLLLLSTLASTCHFFLL